MKTRADKDLYNVPPIADHIIDVEVFLGDWSRSVSATRTHNGAPIPPECVYTLNPLDPRLHIAYVNNPSVEDIKAALAGALELGYEGLVLRQGNKWLRVKPAETYDVYVTGYVEGKGKHAGRMGALWTKGGKVGTGFKDADRQLFAELQASGQLLNTLIEVECMGLTAKRKFRHARFKRIRTDKLEETNLDD